MKLKQQTKIIKNSTDSDLPFEQAFINVIREAKSYGWNITKTKEFITKNWKEIVITEEALEEENEDEKKFREKVDLYFNKNYDSFTSKMEGTRTPYIPPDRICKYSEIPQKFVNEVGVSVYKAFEMDHLDRKAVKEITVKRTKILFPEVRAQTLVFLKIFSHLLEYAYLQTSEIQECNKFINQYETGNKYEERVCRFVWLINHS